MEKKPLRSVSGSKAGERWEFLREALIEGSPLRWLALEYFPPHLSSELTSFLKSLGHCVVWDLPEELLSLNPAAYPAGAPVTLVIDCLHPDSDARFSYSLKKALMNLREASHVRLILALRSEFTERNLPEVYGAGRSIDCTTLEGAKSSSLDDRLLLQHSRRLFPKYQMQDLVLGPKTSMKLEESIHYIRTKEFCENEWGFRKRHSRGHGVTLLFHGPSGTGKTMAAEVVANTVQLPIYQVDLSSVVSKWVGETEKNLKTIFRAARGVKGVLLFDEGDAIFSSRTEVKGSQDRYTNLEVNYLLQELEAFDGIVILSTNHEKNLDSAFLRRFTYTINFGFPSSVEREKIWRANLPPELPLGSSVDFKALSVFSLSGGNIKNCIRDAAAIAISKGQKLVEQTDLLWAVKRESQKLGLEFSRESVGEQYWRKVGPEWEYIHFPKKGKPSETSEA